MEVTGSPASGARCRPKAPRPPRGSPPPKPLDGAPPAPCMIAAMLTFSPDPQTAEQQMNAIIFYLTAFGYIDGDFDLTEKTFVRVYIRQLVDGARRGRHARRRRRDPRDEVVKRSSTHFHEVFEQIDRARDGPVRRGGRRRRGRRGVRLRQAQAAQLRDLPAASTATTSRSLLATIDELIYADGTVHPGGGQVPRRDRGAARRGLDVPLGRRATIEVVPSNTGRDRRPGHARAAARRPPASSTSFEQHYSADPEPHRASRLESDHRLIVAVHGDPRPAARQRARAGSPASTSVGDFAGEAPFLDGHVYVHPPKPDQPLRADRARRPARLLQLPQGGAAPGRLLRQARGLASSTRRTARAASCPARRLHRSRHVQLQRRAAHGDAALPRARPSTSSSLRGNHEYYIEYSGRIYGGVKPAEAINTLSRPHPGRGVPGLHEAVRGAARTCCSSTGRCSSTPASRATSCVKEVDATCRRLNDPDIRFQMLWSDPSDGRLHPRRPAGAERALPVRQAAVRARSWQRVGCPHDDARPREDRRGVPPMFTTATRPARDPVLGRRRRQRRPAAASRATARSRPWPSR